MANDTTLNIIDVPTRNYSSIFEGALDYTNPDIYAKTIFGLLDDNDTGFLNFYYYMEFRLFIYSWRKCSPGAPFISEANFECAIEIAADWKTMNRNTARRMFFHALQFSGNGNIRDLDFVTFISFAKAIKLYGKINGKQDNDATRNEMNMALDNGILPLRYTQSIIDDLFRLVSSNPDMQYQNLDLITFTFYDFFLKIFHSVADRGTYEIGLKNFLISFQSQLIPTMMKKAILKIPQNNLTSSSYQMYTYLNVSMYQDENDHFMKSFIEEEASFLTRKNKIEKWSTQDLYRNDKKFKFNLKKTLTYLFNSIDSDMNGSVSFYDFGNVCQIVYLFARFDTYGQGRIAAGDLHERFSHYDDYPQVAHIINERGHIFNEFPQDLYMDVYSAILCIRIQDLFRSKIRRSNDQMVTEVELKQVLAFVNRGAVPDSHLNKCLRAPSKENVPLYDWECAFVQAESSTMVFYENSYDKLTVSKQNLTLLNTVFYHIDPSLEKEEVKE